MFRQESLPFWSIVYLALRARLCVLLFPLRREAILIESTLEVWIELIDCLKEKLTSDDPAKRMTYRRATNGGVLW